MPKKPVDASGVVFFPPAPEQKNMRLVSQEDFNKMQAKHDVQIDRINTRL